MQAQAAPAEGPRPPLCEQHTTSPMALNRPQQSSTGDGSGADDGGGAPGSGSEKDVWMDECLGIEGLAHQVGLKGLSDTEMGRGLRGDRAGDDDDASDGAATAALKSSVMPGGGGAPGDKRTTGRGRGGGAPGRDGSKGGSAAATKAKACKAMKVRCRGCCKGYSDSDFPVSSIFCWDCKRALDNIARQARAQGPDAQTWLSECRKDELKVRVILQSYFEKCPPATMSRGKSRGTWNLVSYMETYRAESSVRRTAKGKLMWFGEFMEFAMSTKGGRLAEDEAKGRWEAMRADPDVLKDEGGPEKSRFRVCVEKGHYMEQSDSWSHNKEIQLKERDMKKATVESVEALKKRMARDHNALDDDGQLAAVAKGLMRSSPTSLAGGMTASSSSGFVGAGLLLGDIQELLPVQEQHEESSVAPASPAPTEFAAVGAELASVTQARWFDRKPAVTRAVRTAVAKIEAASTALGSVSAALALKIKEVEALPDTEQRDLRTEASTAKERLAAVSAVLGSVEELERVRAAVKCGEMPLPCENFNMISTIAALKVSIEDCITEVRIHSEDNIKECLARFEEERKQLMALVRSAKTALSDLQSAQRSRERLSKQRARAAEAACAQSGPKRAKKESEEGAGSRGRCIFELGPSSGTTMRSFSSIEAAVQQAQAAGLHNILAEPCVVSDATFRGVDKDAIVRPVVVAFSRMLSTSAPFLSSGRAGQPIRTAEAVKAVEGLLAKLSSSWCCLWAKDKDVVGPLPAIMQRSMQPSLFAVAHSVESVYNEPLYQAAFRLTTHGTRSVVMAAAADLASFLEAQAPQEATPGSSGQGAGEGGGGAPSGPAGPMQLKQNGGGGGGTPEQSGGGAPNTPLSGGGAPSVCDSAVSSGGGAPAGGSGGGAPILQTRLWSALLTMTAERVQDFLRQRYKIFATTVGEGDLLYIPPGWVICERCEGKVTSMGVRIGLVLPSVACFKKAMEGMQRLSPDGKGQDSLITMAAEACLTLCKTVANNAGAAVEAAPPVAEEAKKEGRPAEPAAKQVEPKADAGAGAGSEAAAGSCSQGNAGGKEEAQPAQQKKKEGRGVALHFLPQAAGSSLLASRCHGPSSFACHSATIGRRRV